MLAVRRATHACRAVQAEWTPAAAIVKGDRSPVTVADFASQALIGQALRDASPDVPVLAEEGTDLLRRGEHRATLEAVVRQVQDVLDRRVDPEDALRWIDHGRTADGTEGRFWTVDPIDGTKGFLRGDQYAVALALVEAGRPVLALLGCPNWPSPSADRPRGSLLVAERGRGTVRASLDGTPTSAADPFDGATRLRVDEGRQTAAIRLVESVEAAHSAHGVSARIVARLRIQKPPLRLDSQVKYGAVAAGEASVYLRVPTSKAYRENVWDHAAGALLVEEAGGRVTDAWGGELPFGKGRGLAAGRGILATNGRVHDDVVVAVRAEMDPP